ncbi:FtsQ-type POTRA domain-containing protein [Eubacteriales bacterium OttesenSCG-928-K08]|nr:FtsQ-type POTRA domain-containing protein [Eubacteriales bacterium OttesenSCG-928-K08]
MSKEHTGQMRSGRDSRQTRVYEPINPLVKRGQAGKTATRTSPARQAPPVSSYRRQGANVNSPQKKKYPAAPQNRSVPARPSARAKKSKRRVTLALIIKMLAIKIGKNIKALFARKDKPQTSKRSEPVSLKTVIVASSCVVAVIGMLLAGYFLFQLEYVVVEGNTAYAAEQIVELSALTNGKHMLLCDLEGAKANIETNPYIQVMEIVREYPRTICVRVKERQEVAAISSQGYDVVVDEQGYVLSIGMGSDLSSLLRVTGMSQHGYQVNKPIGEASDIQVDSMRAIITNLKDYGLLDKMALLDLSNPLRVSMETREGIDIVLGQADGLGDKMKWIVAALPSIEISNDDGGVLDVSARSGAIYSPVQQEETLSNTNDDTLADENDTEPIEDDDTAKSG